MTVDSKSTSLILTLNPHHRVDSNIPRKPLFEPRPRSRNSSTPSLPLGQTPVSTGPPARTHTTASGTSAQYSTSPMICAADAKRSLGSGLNQTDKRSRNSAQSTTNSSNIPRKRRIHDNKISLKPVIKSKNILPTKTMINVHKK